ncbi:uncharacterized protein LOC103190281 [Callorhinchus milii]|uniref:uncharacterized protein LOC103190281 n=1 Tax=Callorhinchus milii TaxID=7868 RepID=UPI001C3F7850|nr:uncharacterized protein LOC103190281 [Callorhinchus milii]XP_042197989.1 uncharacterized protein LOC103190281 [Callorhinchus milii]XP_042197990.1 uncharacterized protein LOC103190281 [Callorhinchus milii]XP_042197992.1 uncharacterized protein LOC103190281 [Callorhinchus milii]
MNKNATNQFNNVHQSPTVSQAPGQQLGTPCASSSPSSVLSNARMSSGAIRNMPSPGTYIQIPVNSEVRCVNTASLPLAVQQKIFGGSRGLPKVAESNRLTTAIYICPVLQIKAADHKHLFPLASPRKSTMSATDPVQTAESASPETKEPSKPPPVRTSDPKVNRVGREGAITPTPVSVKFCNNLASQVLKKFVKQQANGGSVENLLQACSSLPMEIKSAHTSFKENALLLYNSQLYFLAQKSVDLPTVSEKRSSPVMASAQPPQRLPNIPTSCTTTKQNAGSQPPDGHHKPTIKRKVSLKYPESGTKAETSFIHQDRMKKDVQDLGQNGLDLTHKVAKPLPKPTAASCMTYKCTEDERLLLQAGINSDVRILLHRIHMKHVPEESGKHPKVSVKHVSEIRAATISASSKQPDSVGLECCPVHAEDCGPAEYAGYPEQCKETNPVKLTECPQLFNKSDPIKVPQSSELFEECGSMESERCPELPKESNLLAGSPEFLKEPDPIKLVECPNLPEECGRYPDLSVKTDPVKLLELKISTQPDPVPGGLEGCPELPKFEFEDCSIQPTPVHLENCSPIASSPKEETFCTFERKRKEVATEETETSDHVTSDTNSQSMNTKRRKNDEGNVHCENLVESCEMESSNEFKTGASMMTHIGNSVATSPDCLEVLSSLELSDVAEENTPSFIHKLDMPGMEASQDLTLSNPLEVDETVRDEKINRLKEMLKEKQMALEEMRRKTLNTLSHLSE